jgi:DNA repair protein RecN (Recombination protein N)
MLTRLGIKNLAIVETLELTLAQGFSVLTGETGAGKSILLNALGFGLGGKADTGQIRPGADRAEVSLVFDVSDAADARAWLEENDLAEADECLIRRVMTIEGRSRAYVNTRQVTLSALQTLGSCLVEIHGQHAHVHLLKAAEQRRLLDEAAGNAALLSRADQLFQSYRKTQRELLALTTAARDQAAREALLRFQVEELEQAEIASLHYDHLAEEQTRLANVGKIQETGQHELDNLYEGEQHAVVTRLSQSIHALAEITQLAPEFGECVQLLEEARVQVSEAASTLRRRLERLDADPARLGQLEQKLADLHHLARKHHIRPQSLPDHLQQLTEELERITHHAGRTSQLEQALDTIRHDYAEVAQALSARRLRTGQDMAERISACIQELGMPQGRFLIDIRHGDTEPNAHGNDSVEFLVSANPGLPPRTLAKVASGGELSRISLAIQVTATDSRTIPTLVFDEVDTGIGGRVAEMVGQRLKTLSQGRQIMCVTHLPQVAAQAHHHLRVQKGDVNGMTHSTVCTISLDERIGEIARMLGGVHITPQTLAHAREMLGHSSPDSIEPKPLP